MAEKRIENNWYEILELEYYPNPEENEEKIKAKIEEKRKEWTNRCSRPLADPKYKKYSDLLNKGTIEKEMLDCTRRKELIKDAQEKFFEAVDKFLKPFENRIISEKKIIEISEKINRNKELVRERIKENGKIELYNENIYIDFCKWLNKKYDSTTEQNFKTIGKNLRILGKKDLYDFLDSEGLNVKRLSEKEILEEIKEKRKILTKPESETSAKRDLFAECKKILENKEERKKYDEYLNYLKHTRANEKLKEIKEVYEVTEEEISKEQSRDFIENINKIIKDEKISKNIFIGYCEENKIPYKLLFRSNKKKETDDSREEEETQNNNNEFEKQKELSNKACEKALRALQDLKFKEASKYLKEAKDYWLLNPNIERISNEIIRTMGEITNILKEITSYMENQNYEMARQLYEALKQKYPKFLNNSLESIIYEITNTVREIKSHIENQNYGTARQLYEALKQKYSDFSDSWIERALYPEPEPKPKKSKTVLILIAVTTIMGFLLLSSLINKHSSNASSDGSSQEKSYENSNSENYNENQSSTNNSQTTTNKTKKLSEITNLTDLNNEVDKIKQGVLDGTDTLDRFSSYELKIIRNSFFAREGYIFHKNSDMIDYFNRMQGYKGYTYDEDRIKSNFTIDEKNFIDRVLEEEHRRR